MHAWKTIFSFQAGPFSNDMLIFLGINLLTDQMLQTSLAYIFEAMMIVS